MTENEGSLIPHYIKDDWRQGEWDNEPDRVDFIHAGFSCFILRNTLGTWCGYVGIPNTHPLYEKPYDDAQHLDVHGGLTYAGKCSPPICHVPEPGLPDDVWWYGFDTGHWNDICPSRYVPIHEDDGSSYKNVEYVTNEVKLLADQLKELEMKK